LFVRPYWRFSVSIQRHSSGVFVTPSGIAPASIMRCTVGAFSSLRIASRETRPAVGHARHRDRFLDRAGHPEQRRSSSTLGAAPTRESAASASARAASKRSTTTALMRSCMCSMRSMWASTTSRDVVSPVRIARARSIADRSVRAWGGARTAMAAQSTRRGRREHA
jgi:hypothetical protein